jgi:hypothetical protein
MRDDPGFELERFTGPHAGLTIDNVVVPYDLILVDVTCGSPGRVGKNSPVVSAF